MSDTVNVIFFIQKGLSFVWHANDYNVNAVLKAQFASLSWDLSQSLKMAQSVDFKNKERKNVNSL